jgi:hypothetical protein
LNKTVEFDAKDTELLRSTIEAINKERSESAEGKSKKPPIDAGLIAYRFTTQCPLTRSDLIGIAADRANQKYLDGVAKEEVKVSWSEFNQNIADLQVITARMYQDKKDDTAIYNKLFVDLNFLKEMREFILHQVRIIENSKDRHIKDREVLDLLRKNRIDAIKATGGESLLDKILNRVKPLVSGALVGAGTFLAAKAEMIDWFGNFVATPTVAYITVVTGAILGILGYDATRALRKALAENHIIRKYSRKIRNCENAEKNDTRKILKLVGYKATKEIATSGYIETLLSDVSNTYLALAYKGDFGALNSLYDKQVKRVYASGLWRFFHPFAGKTNGETKMEASIDAASKTSDGYVKPTGAPKDEAGAPESPSATQ